MYIHLDFLTTTVCYKYTNNKKNKFDSRGTRVTVLNAKLQLTKNCSKFSRWAGQSDSLYMCIYVTYKCDTYRQFDF